MSDLFLIAHKVRSLPAFDIAEQTPCPICQVEADPIYHLTVKPIGPDRIGDCDHCNDTGIVWIIPTSGHRAHPYQYLPLLEIDHRDTGWSFTHWAKWATDTFLKEDLPDHYPLRPTKPDPSSGKSLLAKLGLIPKVVRRL